LNLRYVDLNDPATEKVIPLKAFYSWPHYTVPYSTYYRDWNLVNPVTQCFFAKNFISIFFIDTISKSINNDAEETVVPVLVGLYEDNFNSQYIIISRQRTVEFPI